MVNRIMFGENNLTQVFAKKIQEPVSKTFSSPSISHSMYVRLIFQGLGFMMQTRRFLWLELIKMDFCFWFL